MPRTRRRKTGITEVYGTKEYWRAYDVYVRTKNIPKAIRWDVGQWDRVRGFINTVSEETIARIISNPCLYCGETTLKITLDRKDNTKGHSEDNVNPCCIRCNLLRKDMPYEAWLELCSGLRSAREKGLFGEWTGCLKKPLLN